MKKKTHFCHRPMEEEEEEEEAVPLAAATAATAAAEEVEDEGKASEKSVSLADLKTMMADFTNARDWGKFHSPRNLLLALVGEVGELSEIFQWKGEVAKGLPGWSDEEREHLGEELSDVLLYLVRLADVCNVNLSEASVKKMEKNCNKYPIDKCKGMSHKYTVYLDCNGRDGIGNPEFGLQSGCKMEEDGLETDAIGSFGRAASDGFDGVEEAKVGIESFGRAANDGLDDVEEAKVGIESFGRAASDGLDGVEAANVGIKSFGRAASDGFDGVKDANAGIESFGRAANDGFDGVEEANAGIKSFEIVKDGVDINVRKFRQEIDDTIVEAKDGIGRAEDEPDSGGKAAEDLGSVRLVNDEDLGCAGKVKDEVKSAGKAKGKVSRVRRAKGGIESSVKAKHGLESVGKAEDDLGNVAHVKDEVKSVRTKAKRGVGRVGKAKDGIKSAGKAEAGVGKAGDGHASGGNLKEGIESAGKLEDELECVGDVKHELGSVRKAKERGLGAARNARVEARKPRVEARKPRKSESKSRGRKRNRASQASEE